MTIAEARQELSAKEMSELEEKALEGGSFVIKSITRVGKQAEVKVWYPDTRQKRTISVGGM